MQNLHKINKNVSMPCAECHSSLSKKTSCNIFNTYHFELKKHLRVEACKSMMFEKWIHAIKKGIQQRFPLGHVY